MTISPPNFRLIYSLINWLDYQSQKINQAEVESAYQDVGREFHQVKDPATGEWYDYFIGFSSKYRFLLVLLSVSKEDPEQLIVHKIDVAHDTQQIWKLYYEPTYRRKPK